MTTIDEDKSPHAKKLTETRMPLKHHETPIPLATNAPLPSNPLLLPRTLTPNTVRTFIKLLTQNGTPIIPTRFTHIANLKTYQQALHAFPLIQHHPKFEQLHKHVHAYFHLKENPPRHPNGKLQIHSFTKQYGISKSTVHNWINDIRRPHLLHLLENRATTLKAYQDRVAKIRETLNKLITIQDVTRRLSSTHFMFAEKLQADSNFTDHITKATKYLSILQLVEVGYHPRDLEIHFHLHKDYIGDLLRYHHRPYIIKLAANIPPNPPPPRTKWLPTTTDPSNIPTRNIPAPHTITDWQQLIPLLNQLPSLNQPDEHLICQLDKFGPQPDQLQLWKNEFGKISTSKDRLLAFAYLIGTSLSDGWITQQSTYSSTFGIELSKKYTWAPHFGNRTAYYWTSLGQPTKPGSGFEPCAKEPHGKHNWFSVTNPFFTWFNEVVLGFQPGQTHTDTPAQINWVLIAPKEFQIKVLQGLFDGDGWATQSLNEIGIHNRQNRSLIKKLLRRNNISAIDQGAFELVLHSNKAIKTAATLPLFLSATGRQFRAQAAHDMSEAHRPEGKIFDSKIIRRVLELRQKESLTKERIRLTLYKEHGTVISPKAISRIIRDGVKRLAIDELKIRAYFLLLEYKMKHPTLSRYELVHRVRKVTGFQGNIKTMSGWLRCSKVPYDVKLALSDGYPVAPEFIEVFPHLRKYLPKEIKD